MKITLKTNRTEIFTLTVTIHQVKAADIFKITHRWTSLWRIGNKTDPVQSLFHLRFNKNNQIKTF